MQFAFKPMIEGHARAIADWHYEGIYAFCDVDRDGDDDVIFGGEHLSHQIWWWENPFPNYDPQVMRFGGPE